MKPFVIVATLLVVSAAQGASAQTFLNPFVDTSLSAPSASARSSKPGLGAAFGRAGRVVGFETEVAYHPEVIDNTANALAKNRVFTFSQNFLVGPTIGRVKPYGAIGFGDLYLNVTGLKSVAIPNPQSISSNYFTANAGGGVLGFISSHFGLRADLRYFRAYGFKVSDLETAGLALDRFDFWRANVGIAVTF